MSHATSEVRPATTYTDCRQFYSMYYCGYDSQGKL